MLPHIEKFLNHLGQSNESKLNVSLSFSRGAKNSGYLRDLFRALGDCISGGVYSDARMEVFTEKYRNKLFESGISFEDQELDHKYYKVDYAEKVEVPKKKVLNAFYKVDDEMFDSEDELEEGNETDPQDQQTGLSSTFCFHSSF